MSRWLTPQSLPNDPTSGGPKVFAAGLWRCATSSLQIAFEEILTPPLRPSMHGVYVLTSVPRLKLCVRACRETSKPKRQALLRQIFTGYNASSDYPGMAFADDLIEMYPDMKIVLNKRKTAEAWAKSANDTLHIFSTWRYAICCWMIPTCYWHWRVYREYANLARRRFGKDIDTWSPEYYDVHNEWVREVARKHGREVLEWEPTMGWESLCTFLGVEVPEVKFPRVNDTQEINSLRGYIFRSGLATWVVLFVGLGCLWYGVRRWV
ncbi:hypothetical protein B0J11DRAFT_542327 [Dendryphion nanum]|uniref:Uncharacterized protein n=1 Tax=Dendryphion nanum TaxID=256645 RepID=A0A9P9IAY8_9PLEO|nr:hypothetical protein B0J11DRAFT_542327 [Dendryphion nanum]